MHKRAHFEELRLIPSASSSAHDDLELDGFDETSSTHSFITSQQPRWLLWSRRRQRRPLRRKRSIYRSSCRTLVLVICVITALLAICGTFFPSYSNPPNRYVDLRKIVEKTGTWNVNNEKIFIAASLYDKDGDLMSGDWGRSVLSLIEVLGPQNVFLSLYENDVVEKSKQALDKFRETVTCNSSIVSGHLDMAKLLHVTTVDGTSRLKRIAYLAEARNNALRPLDDPASPAYDTRFDKLLYLNDVIFDPVDAANLLFSTNQEEKTGRTQYRAACAVDFINPFKFYDTFATRDLEGFDMGVPFFPWFTGAGQGTSRKDVLAQRDAVRVKSCWGGMVAFEARWFQSRLDSNAEAAIIQTDIKAGATHGEHMSRGDPAKWNSGSLQHLNWTNSTQTTLAGIIAPRSNNATYMPLRFRAETDTYWDASECCLIHADLAELEPKTLASSETGVYMNPYIRVAYSKHVLLWLLFTKRFERLYTPVHTLANWIAGRPSSNTRQWQRPGDEVTEKVWMWDEQSAAALQNGTVNMLPNGLHGAFQEVQRKALPGRFCGSRKLLYINENPADGERSWASEKMPSFD